MGKIIGIDLGTTNSLVAVWEDGQSRLIPNAFGEYLTPSVISVDEDGSVYVGKVAKERLISHPEKTVSVFKRVMGTKKNYRIAGKTYRPEELSSLVLRKLKEDAEKYLGEPVEEAIISVPAYFSDMARKATKDAGRLAGLRVERIINEPSAAALACQMEAKQEEALLLVFDFGGGTLDVSLVDCFDNVIEIVAVSGDNHLGGSDFDRVIAEWFCGKYGRQFEEQTREMQEILLRSAEELKCRLTEAETGVMTVTSPALCGQQELSRKELIRIAAPLFQKMSVPVKRVLTDGEAAAEAISGVVLVGGSCKMQIVQQYLRYLLKGARLSVADPDYMIALGVGAYAGIKERNSDIRDMLLTDICPFSLGTAVHNEANYRAPLMKILIERNSPLPFSREERFYTVRDKQKRLAVEIYQGEEVYAGDNTLLGKLEVAVPPAERGEETILVRFTYDINGLLVVDVTVESTQKKKQLIILNDEISMPEEELQNRLKELEKLKIHPRDKEENRLLLEKGGRLYAQLTGEVRQMVADRIKYLEYLLATQDEYKIQKGKKYVEVFLDRVEEQFLLSPLSWMNEEKFEQWYDKEAEEEIVEDYTNWSQGHYLS